MSLRDLLRAERLKIRLAANQAKSGGLPRLGGMGGGVLATLSRARATHGEAAPSAPVSLQEPGFSPTMPLLQLLQGGVYPESRRMGAEPVLN